MEQEKEYTVDYFINKFEAIPEDEWFVGYFQNEYNSKQKCALGHCDYDNISSSKEGRILINLLNGYVSEINDGKHTQYQQTTPKQRILAALYDVK